MENKPAYDEIVANLQKRVWIYAVIAISTFVAAFNFSERLTEWLGDKLLPDDATLVYLSPDNGASPEDSLAAHQAYNRFMESVTGFNAKQRVDRAKARAKKEAKAAAEKEMQS